MTFAKLSVIVVLIPSRARGVRTGRPAPKTRRQRVKSYVLSWKNESSNLMELIFLWVRVLCSEAGRSFHIGWVAQRFRGFGAADALHGGAHVRKAATESVVRSRRVRPGARSGARAAEGISRWPRCFPPGGAARRHLSDRERTRTGVLHRAGRAGDHAGLLDGGQLLRRAHIFAENSTPAPRHGPGMREKTANCFADATSIYCFAAGL